MSFKTLLTLYSVIKFNPPQLDEAAKAYEKGIQSHTRSVPLWLCAAESAQLQDFIESEVS